MRDKSLELQAEAIERAEALRPVFAELAGCQCRFNFPHLCRSKIPQAAGNGDQPAV